MKKVLLAMSAAFILYACGGGGDKPAEVKKDSPATAEAPKPSPAANSEKILTLIAEKNCAPTCHTIEKKVIGPAYIDVSKKYEATPANIEMLANKVIKGGSGVWGEVPMTPNNITLDEAKEIVTYILNLKNTQ